MAASKNERLIVLCPSSSERAATMISPALEFGQAQERRVEARAVPDLARVGRVDVEARELEDLEPEAAPARRVVEEAQVIGDPTPVVRRLGIVHPAELQRDQPVQGDRMVEVQARQHTLHGLLVVSNTRPLTRNVGLSGTCRVSATFPSLGSQDFRRLTDQELAAEDDDRLLDHIRTARALGYPGEARRALQALVLANVGDVRRRVRMKVPARDVEDVTQEAMISALGAAFAGETVGEFRSWLNTIVGRRIADHHRPLSLDVAPLPEENAGDEDTWGSTPESLGADADEMELRMEIGSALAELSPVHQAVVVAYCYMQWPAAKVVEDVNGRFPDADMTENNVQQIGSRFRRTLRERLE